MEAIGALPALARGSRAFQLRPAEVIVAWRGVLCLVFEGWPESVAELKARMDTDGEFTGLRQENSGSKVPKMSVACLRDGRVLTKEEVRTLQRICDEVRIDGALRFDTAHACIFQWCSLERLILSTPMRLGDDSGGRYCASVDRSQADMSTQMRSEAKEDHLDSYYPHVAADGNRENGHYRKSRWGGTLVAFATKNANPVINAQNEKALRILDKLRRRVEETFPGYFAFFDSDALHVTLRALL